MKKLLLNNQIIITALAIMIAIAGYLNFSNNNSKNIGMSGEFFEASKEVIAENVEEKTPGEAVLVNSNIKLDYFYAVKLEREQTRAKNKEELIKVAENKTITEKEREVAINKIVELTSNSEKENAAEMMLEAKGFKNTVVSIVDDKVDVVVDRENITSEEVAQIVDVINRKTGIDISKIVVTPINAKENNS